jgi:hypothetical protein
MLDAKLYSCLVYILQHGINEAKARANEDWVFTVNLLDALDNIPQHIFNWTSDSERLIEEQLAVLSRTFPNDHTNYLYLLLNRVCLLQGSEPGRG